jgi:hypothetical protein
MKVTRMAAARAWLREHCKEIPAELPPPWTLEPVQRGHRGHTYAVLDVELVAGGDDPLAWLIARESLAERVAHASPRDVMLLRDAQAALSSTDRRAPGWTGRVIPTRSQERGRARHRAAQDAGQAALFCEESEVLA